MKTKLTTIIFAVAVLALPLLAIADEIQTLDKAMADARVELKRDFVRRQKMQERMSSNFQAMPCSRSPTNTRTSTRSAPPMTVLWPIWTWR